MKVNSVKHALAKGQSVIGTMVTECRTPEVGRMLAAAGFDFIVHDQGMRCLLYSSDERFLVGAAKAAAQELKAYISLRSVAAQPMRGEQVG